MTQDAQPTEIPQEKGSRVLKEFLSSTGPIGIGVALSTVVLNAKGMADLISGAPANRLLLGFGIVGPILLTLVLAAGWLPRYLANSEAVRTRLIVSALAALIWGTGISFGAAVYGSQQQQPVNQAGPTPTTSPPTSAPPTTSPPTTPPASTAPTAGVRVLNSQDITLDRDYSIDLHADPITRFTGCIAVCDANVRSDSLRGNSTTYTRMNGPADYDKCATAGPGIKIIPKNDLTPNSVYCVKTNDNRFASITILATDPSPPASGDLKTVTMRVVSWIPVP